MSGEFGDTGSGDQEAAYLYSQIIPGNFFASPIRGWVHYRGTSHRQKEAGWFLDCPRDSVVYVRVLVCVSYCAYLSVKLNW